MTKTGMTVSRFILEQEHKFPEATGEFTDILNRLVIAGKVVSREVNKAGLVDLLGFTGDKNVQGEKVQKLDEFANKTFIMALSHHAHVGAIATEEEENILTPPGHAGDTLRYAVSVDPLDGSSNIDANVSIGTIFGIHRRHDPHGPGNVDDFLQPGTELAASGYFLYGSSTMLVYTTGVEVHGFTLDPSLGEFLLSHENIRIPKKGKYYSVNEGNSLHWEESVRSYVAWLKEKDKDTGRPYSLRYIGSLVADFHRTLLYGGIFLYPMDYKDPAKPKGKLRLLYEAQPLAQIVETAGGRATDGREPISAIQPETIHQRVPLIIGSEEDVDRAMTFLSSPVGAKNR